MKLPRFRYVLLAVVVLLLVMLLAGTALAQNEWCVSSDPAIPVGCAEITLAPAGTTANFYLNNVPIAMGQNPGRLILPPGTHTILIGEIQSTEAGFGNLFVYDNASTSVTVTAGNVTARTVNLTKRYIRGTVAMTCDIRGAAATDSVMCQVSIEGNVQPELLAPGEVRNYILEPSLRGFTVTLVGDSASLFTPPFRDQGVTVTPGRTTQFKPRFDKKGFVTASLDQPNVVGDWFIDGVQVATQVASIEAWVEPARNHRIDVRLLNDPTAAGIYSWRDASTNVLVGSGQSRAVVVRLTKVFHKGFLDLTCDIKAAVPEDQIWCAVTIDGVAQPDLVAPGQVKNYVLDPGARIVSVALTGPSAQFWAPPTREQRVTITAGRTATFKPAFLKAGNLTANLSVPNAVADWYVDGALVATQAPSINVWLEPSKSHRIEAKLINDPAAAGMYTWRDATQSVTLTPAQVRTVTLTPQQVWLVGFIELTCNITNFQPGMSCLPILDGVPQPLVPAAGVTTYTVPTGAHSLVVSIDPASEWGSTPRTFNTNVQGGRTFEANATLTAAIPTFQITLVNNSYTAVCNVFLSLASDPLWGTDKLAGQINPGQSRTFTVEKGTYDLYAQNCKTNPLDVQYNISITAPYTWVVNGPPMPPGPPATFTIRNNSVLSWCYVFFSPTFLPDWIPYNWLGPDQVLLPNSSRQFQLTQGFWDMLLLDCSGAWYLDAYFLEVGSNYTYTISPLNMREMSELNLPNGQTIPLTKDK